MSTVTVDPGIHEQGRPWPAHFEEPGFDGDPHVVVRTADTPSARRAVAQIIETWMRVDASGRVHGPFADRLDPAALEMYELGSPSYSSVSRISDGFVLYVDTDGEHTRAMVESLVRVAVDLLEQNGVEARLSAPTAGERDGGDHVTDAELDAWAAQQ